MRGFFARLLRRGGRVELRRWSLMRGGLAAGDRLVTFTHADRGVSEARVLAETLDQFDGWPNPRLRLVRWELRRVSGELRDEWRITWDVEPRVPR